MLPSEPDVLDFDMRVGLRFPRPISVSTRVSSEYLTIGQVGQQTGTSLEAARSIVASEGFGGLFVGFQEQLLREIPFNAIQFATYEVQFCSTPFWLNETICVVRDR